jgi:hypothetical protein
MHFSIQIWDRKTGVLLNDLPNLHAGRVFSVVGDRTKAVSTGLDQVSRSRVISTRPICRCLNSFCLLDPAANHHLGLWVWSGYQFCRNVIVVVASSRFQVFPCIEHPPYRANHVCRHQRSSTLSRDLCYHHVTKRNSRSFGRERWTCL